MVTSNQEHKNNKKYPLRSRRYRQQTNIILTLELRLQMFANVIEMFVMLVLC